MAVDGTAIIFGVGPGLGAALARTFAGAGMDVATASRATDALTGLMHEIAAKGVRARAYACDATSEGDVEEVFARTAADLGEPRVVIYNAGLYLPGSILEITADDFERCWRVGCFGGFLVGRAAARLMMRRLQEGDPGGTIIFTGATASLRGSARFANLAVGKFGLRALAQSMARELAPQGVHVAHVVIDGMIAYPRTGAAANDSDSKLDPDAVAANYLHLHRQPRSAWTHELDLRPCAERF